MERQRLNGVESNQINSPYEFNLQELQNLSTYIRKRVFEVCIKSGAGHVGGSSSSVEMMTSLYFGGVLNYDPNNLRHPDRDRVLVRGHLGPLRYPIFALLGEVKEEELTTYREFGSRLQGHEEYQLVPGVDITPSGSLGMLLSYGVGASVVAKETGKSYKTYVFLGDGEEEEGNISEAARHAASLGLDNLIVILDKNKKQLSNPVSETDIADVARTWQGYGWETLEIENGHNIEEVLSTFNLAKKINKPVIVISNTVKGYGLPGAEEHFSGYHTIGTFPKNRQQEALEAIGQKINTKVIEEIIAKIDEKINSGDFDLVEKQFAPIKLSIQPSENTSINTDESQLEYFQKLRERILNMENKPKIFFLTADVTRRDTVEALQIKDFATFLNIGIREQHMIAMSHGLSLSDPSCRVIVNSNDAFVYRSIDQLNALCQGQGNVIIIGDLAGITNSRNGKTHQTAGQPGAILNLPGVTMLEPGDVKDLYNCLNWAIGESRGAVFIRMHRSEIKPFDRKSEDNENIQYYVPFASQRKPEITLVASGFTTGPSIEASQYFDSIGIPIQVINVVNHKTLDEGFVRLFPNGKPVLTIYNGSAQVLQSNVAKAIMEYGINFPSKIVGHGFEYGTTGKLEDLARYFKLDKEGIIEIVRNII